MKSLVVSFLVFTLSLNAYSAQSLSTKVSGQYSSIRALGMGNAFTAVADDYSLIYYNPAGFARKPYNEVQFTLVGAGVSSKTLTIMKDIGDASDTPGTDNDKAQAISDVLEKYYGESLGGKVQAVELFWVRKGWGVALTPVDLTVDMTVNRQLGPALDLNVKGDSSFALGWGTSLNKAVDIGITGKFLHRVSVEQSVSALELAADSNVLSEDRFKEGTRVDFDLGFMWTPDWFAGSSTAAPEVAPTPAPEVKSEDIKPDAQAAEAKTEDAAKPADAKPADQKAGEPVKPEEDRKPQAEGDAPVVAQATDEKKPEDAAKPEDKKTEEAKQDAAATTAEKPKEEVKAETIDAATPVAKPEEAAPVVKLGEGESKPEEVKTGNEINAGAGYPLTFGLVVYNVIATDWTLSKAVNKDAVDVPSKIERTISVGSQYRLYDGEDLKIRAMLDFQNLLHPEISLQKSTHIGAEFDYSPSGWFKTQFRAGMNQMYYTAGVTLLLGVLNIDVATYGEEVGTSSNKIENRVMAAKLGFNF